MTQQEATRISDIDRERSRLRRLLRSADPKVLNRRPPNGDWSIVENVRHLLWAEQRHLGRFLPGRVEWSRMGMTAFKGREFADVGTKPTNDVGKVFTEWDEIHKAIRKAAKSAERRRHFAGPGKSSTLKSCRTQKDGHSEGGALT